MAAIIFVLSTPVAAEAVHEFRPDLASALFTTIAVITLLDGRLIESDWTRSVSAGIFFALALFSKMTVFPLTIAVSMSALGVATARDKLLEPSGWRPVLRITGLFLLPVVLIAGPQYLISLRQVLKYLYDTQFGIYAELWRFRATLPQHLVYFLDGDGARAMLGKHRFILAIIFVLGGVHLALSRRRGEVLNSLAYAAVVLVASLVPTLNWQKTQFFGVVFHLSLIFSALLILRHLIKLEGDRLATTPWARVLIVSISIAGIVLFQWPTFQSSEEIAHAEQRKQIDDRIIESIMDHKRPGPRTVMLTTTGYVNAELLNYLALARNDSISFDNLAFSRQPSEHQESWPRWIS